MKTYVTDDAVLISEGDYTYKLLKEDEARQWFETHKSWISAIPNEGDEVRQIKTVLRKPEFESNNRLLVMEPGDEALVVRICPVQPSQKTQRAANEPVPRMREREWEYGILKRNN